MISHKFNWDYQVKNKFKSPTLHNNKPQNVKKNNKKSLICLSLSQPEFLKKLLIPEILRASWIFYN